MLISPKGFSSVLKTLAVLSDQKNSPSIAGGGAVFLQLLARKRDYSRKDVRGGVHLAQPIVYTATQIS